MDGNGIILFIITSTAVLINLNLEVYELIRIFILYFTPPSPLTSQKAFHRIDYIYCKLHQSTGPHFKYFTLALITPTYKVNSMEKLSLKDPTDVHQESKRHISSLRHDAIKHRLVQSFLSLIVAYLLSHFLASFLITFVYLYNGFHPEWKKPWESILARLILFAEVCGLLWYMQDT